MTAGYPLPFFFVGMRSKGRSFCKYSFQKVSCIFFSSCKFFAFPFLSAFAQLFASTNLRPLCGDVRKKSTGRAALCGTGKTLTRDYSNGPCFSKTRTRIARARWREWWVMKVIERPAPKNSSRAVYIYFDDDAKVPAPGDALSLIARIQRLQSESSD